MIEEQPAYATKLPPTVNFTSGGLKQPGGPKKGSILSLSLVICLIVTMFFMPVSTFLARYYKETFMNRQFKSVHLWYWVSLKSKRVSKCNLLLFRV